MFLGMTAGGGGAGLGTLEEWSDDHTDESIKPLSANSSLAGGGSFLPYAENETEMSSDETTTVTTVTANPDPYNFANATSSPDPHAIGQPAIGTTVDDDHLTQAYADQFTARPAAAVPPVKPNMLAHVRSIRAACQFPEIVQQLKPIWVSRLEEIKFDGFSDVHLFNAAIVIANRKEPISIEAIADQLTTSGVRKLGSDLELSEKWTPTDVEQWIGPKLLVDTPAAALAFVRNGINSVERELIQGRIQTLGTVCPLEPTDYILELRKLSAKLQVLNQIGGQPADPGILSGRQLVLENPNRGEVLIDGFLRRGMPAMLVSDSKIGKTTLAHNLAVTATRGISWLGFKVMRPLKVLVIDAELDLAELSHKVRTAQEVGELPPELDYDIWSISSYGYDINAAMDGLESAVKPGQYDLIIIDCMGPLVPADKDENSNSDMGPVMLRVSRTSMLLKCCLVGVHHANKGDQTGKKTIDIGAGAGAWSRYCGTWLVISPKTQDPDEEQFIVRGVARGFKPIKQFGLQRTVDEVRGMVHFTVDSSVLPGDKLAEAVSLFVTTYIPLTPTTQDSVIAAARDAGMTKNSASDMLAHAIATHRAWLTPAPDKRARALVCKVDPNEVEKAHAALATGGARTLSQQV